ncbi:hypothetical protein FB561_2706 [Kribbella amoyensis]|uniref:Uncharacterized protein n=1 Tax=Kribbella amoyensis TaxID=996641 RepID=A0A561BRR2_9ACTN|nr:hypothetical protein [Kribbella amoyensis]TWD81590.1 hypothetical protein FB561_2706 [Kribbella amoyensis]
MKYCITCGDALHPERAEKYAYCTKTECQQKNQKDLTIVSVGVNKSADQFLILDEETTEDLAGGRYQDQRRSTYGKPERSTGEPRPEPKKTPAQRPAPTRRRWTEAQQQLAVLYNEQGLNPDQIAAKLGLTRYLVTQMILTAPQRHRKAY